VDARPHMIGVAGPSCAGKTVLSRHLAARLQATILPLDCYYRELCGRTIEERARFNFDEPAALDEGLFLRHLQILSAGKPIERPVYDFATHARTGDVELVKPGRFIIVEGLFALYWPEVRALFRTRVYVDLPDGPCLERRIVRDVRERSRTPESVRRQFEQTVRPMAELHVRPTKAFADLIVAGDAPIQDSVKAVLGRVMRDEG